MGELEIERRKKVGKRRKFKKKEKIEMKKFLLGVISLMLAFVCTVGCSGGTPSGGNSDGGNNESVGGSESVKVDLPSNVKNPFVLKIYNFNGGYGSEWLRALEAGYEAEKAGKEFTVNGKTYDGIDVQITGDKTVLSTMASTEKFSSKHIYFHEDVRYMEYLTTKDMFEDMTEVLTTANPYEDGKTIEDKLSAEQKAFYNVDGKYYALPHYAGYVGLNYNIKRFNDKGYWIKDGYSYDGTTTTLAQCFTRNADQKSAGPDGKKGTEDDGLPRTYAEFYMLCDYIKQRGDIPMTWDYLNRGIYLNRFTQSVVASYEGLEQMSLNYTFDGTATNLVSIDANGTVTKLDDMAITPDNGYELAKQAGKYYALSFLEKIIDNKDWYLSKSGINNTTAQSYFIQGTETGKKVAMLLDGIWWENEADATFTQYAQAGGASRKDSNFGLMPIPAATEEQALARESSATPFTLLDTHNSACWIGKGIDAEEKKIAVDFIQYAYTDKALVEFATLTDTVKSLNYTVSAEDKAKMSTYGRSIVSMQEKSEVVHSFSKSEFWRKNEAELMDYNKVFYATVDGNMAVIPMDSFASGKSAKEYFDGTYTYRQNTLWKSLNK